MNMIVSDNKIISRELLKILIKTKYSKKTSPFSSFKPEQLFYFICPSNGEKIECITFKTLGIDHARHHIIHASTFLEPFWEKFLKFLTIIENNYEKLSASPVLKAFNNYINASKMLGANDDEIMESFIWNPGILVLGPKDRPHTDPDGEIRENKMLLLFDKIFNSKFKHFNNLYKKNIELYILHYLNENDDEIAKQTLKLITCALQNIDDIIAIENDIDDTKFIIRSTKIFRSFWENWLKLLHNGYLVYLWSQSMRKDNKTYSPSHYCFNISSNIEINEKNKKYILEGNRFLKH